MIVIHEDEIFSDDATSIVPYHLIPTRGSSKSMLNTTYISEVINAGYISHMEFDKLCEQMLPVHKEENNMKIRKVVFNNPATIVLWEDGTKTVVKAKDESFDPEKGLAMAIVKKVFGNKGSYYNELKKWLPEKEEE